MWSLALVSNFNTPSQLGRTPLANPSANLYYLYHQCTALLCSNDLWRRSDRECIIRFSTDLKLVPIKRECLILLLLIRSQFQSKESVSYHSYWPEVISSLSQINISHPSVGSVVVHDVFIGSNMVPILISLLIGHMRGTSHESETAWVVCLSRRRMNHSSCLHVAKGYHRGRMNHSPCTQQTTKGRLNHSPYGCSLPQEVPQAPWSSQSSMSIS